MILLSIPHHGYGQYNVMASVAGPPKPWWAISIPELDHLLDLIEGGRAEVIDRVDRRSINRHREPSSYRAEDDDQTVTLGQTNPDHEDHHRREGVRQRDGQDHQTRHHDDQHTDQHLTHLAADPRDTGTDETLCLAEELDTRAEHLGSGFVTEGAFQGPLGKDGRLPSDHHLDSQPGDEYAEGSAVTRSWYRQCAGQTEQKQQNAEAACSQRLDNRIEGNILAHVGLQQCA